MVICIIGSGGKTTLLRYLTKTYRQQGKKVFVTTSTHMFIEPDALLTDDAAVIIQRLQRDGYAMAGLQDGHKLTSLSQTTYDAVCAHADVVLVEGDGSRHLPIKFPNHTEPVIPDNTDHILLVCGMHALGHPAHQVAHRLELVKQCLTIQDNTIITVDHMSKLLLEGYIKPLQKRYPDQMLWLYPAMTYAPTAIKEAEFLLTSVSPYGVRTFDPSILL